MGLLNNWFHKKEKDQLKKTGEKKARLVDGSKEKKVANPEDKHEKHDHKNGHQDKVVETAKSKVKLSKHSTAYKTLVKPLVTEKSAIFESAGKYSFIVSRLANKNQIKEAIREIYGVKPEWVNVANVDGRQVRFGRTAGRRSNYRKAIVTLPKGSTIDIHTGV